MHNTERNRLWNEWLQTDDGKGYIAGWGDLWNQLHTARGKAWVAERMIARRDAEIERLRSIIDVITGPPMTPEEAEAALAELTPDAVGAIGTIDIERMVAFATDPANATPEFVLERMVKAAEQCPGFDCKTLDDARACLKKREIT